MKSFFSAVALVLVVGVPASAESTKADWLRQPTPSEFQSLYPKAAVKVRAGAVVMLTCVAATDGSLKRCTAKSQRYDEYGFEAAAVQMAQYFLMRPATVDGVPVESNVRVPITFSAPVPVKAKRAASNEVRSESDGDYARRVLAAGVQAVATARYGASSTPTVRTTCTTNLGITTCNTR